MAIYPRHRVSSIYLATGLGHASIYFGVRRQNTIQATSAVSHNATSNLIGSAYSIVRLAMRTDRSRLETEISLHLPAWQSLALPQFIV